MLRTLSGAALMLAAIALPARADVLVVVDKAAQELRVIVGGALAHVFKTSTGMYGAGTPVGSYSVERLHRHWYSRKYDNAPMPFSIFFSGAYAIHGTTVISRLGNPASKGCVRLHPKDAEVLFALVQAAGMENTAVIVTGDNPPKPAVPMAVAAPRERRPARPARDPHADYARKLWENRT
jgi:lipoprotein-anchoring transpeptidase ErfK/SrfK